MVREECCRERERPSTGGSGVAGSGGAAGSAARPHGRTSVELGLLTSGFRDLRPSSSVDIILHKRLQVYGKCGSHTGQSTQVNDA